MEKMNKMNATIYHGLFLALLLAPFVIIGLIVRNFWIAPEINWELISLSISYLFPGIGTWMLGLVAWSFLPSR
ncbi:MAG: hypothetical protein NTX00_00705 [Candidatus Parcubacteria bacterium]|nr:hypothetical protein [Candidatus Parcubacteria bacterium]